MKLYLQLVYGSWDMFFFLGSGQPVSLIPLTMLIKLLFLKTVS